MNPTYQLTRHPIGSLREMWASAWPLMLGLMSGSLMFFSDRLILARVGVDAMNAAAHAGLTSYGWMIFAIVVAEVTEVFVGKYNGEGALKKVGTPVWQMLYFTLLWAPVFILGAYFIAPLQFAGTGNTENEVAYFRGVMYFGPFFVSSIALAGFFIGTGSMRVVTWTMITANISNILLDCLFVFGFGMSCFGAGLATGLSQMGQTAIYLTLFLKKSNREIYGTSAWAFDRKQFIDFLTIAVPSAVGRIMEMIAHIIFFRIIINAGKETTTIITLVQSLFLLSGFLVDGLAKGSTAIVSNLFGAREFSLLQKVVRAAMTLHTFIALSLLATLMCFLEPIMQIFFSAADQHLIANAHFLATLRMGVFWMCLYFLFDGFAWIFFGLFTAAGDTKFVMYINTCLTWAIYVLPVYIVVGVYHKTADIAWMVLAFYNLVICTCYYIRYRRTITGNLAAVQN